MDSTTRMNMLYDFYGSLLTDKQRTFMEMYYSEDWSLAEIAEHFQISRQAVHDQLKRTTTQLEEYESKLQLIDRFLAKKAVIHDFREWIYCSQVDDQDRRNALGFLDRLTELEDS